MMNVDIKTIWQKRSQDFLQEALGYWRLIGSSGLLGTSVILFILGVIYYPDFLEWLPEKTPVALILSILLGFLLFRAPFRTLLKEADILFLAPLEQKMEKYFNRAFVYNYFVQASGVLLVLVIISPLYVQKVSGVKSLWLFFLVPLILKGWNLQSVWFTYRMQDERKRILHAICRFLFHSFFMYWFMTKGSLLWLIVFSLIILGFYFIDHQSKKNNGFNWLYLLEMEKELDGRFYSFASLFIDVPHAQSKVKKRRILAGVTKFLPFQPTHAYKYLYLKTFARANDFSGIYVRLTLIGMIVVYWIPDDYGKMIAYGIFLLMMSIQLKSLYSHHEYQFWFKLFPLPTQQLKDDFRWLTRVLLLVQSLIMFLPIPMSTDSSIVWIALPVIGLGYSIYFSSIYLRKGL